MSAPESSSPEALPGHKAKKYDRQLRLWGDHGQSALESAKVCLINATATGTEILKNVILPGVGSFTIVDGNKISGEDVGNNFFLDKDAIGQSRAKISTDLLLELNDDVHGDFVEESVDNLLDNDSRFFDNFTIVIATDLPERSLLRLASVLWEAGVPLMVCRSYGFIGYIRMVLKEHTVVESHPDSTHEDLRLDRPFQALSAYCDSLHLEAMSKKDHSHTPWLVLIFKYLQKWKAEHEGAGPKNYREKNQLKELIREGILKNDEGVPADEENFDEAITHVNASLVPTQIPSYVKQLFEDQSCLSINSESKPFWILTRALKEYVDNEGQGALPLRGSIPDMTSDSERYIALQNVYKSKADSDMQMFSQYVQTLQETLGRDEPLTSERYRSPSSSPGKPQDLITDADVKLFCKNASFLRVIRTRSLAEEYDQSTVNISELAMHIENGDDDDVIFYVMLRAVDKYYAEFSSYPGTYLDSLEADIPKLKSSLNKVLQEWGISHQVKDEYVHELCRYGAAELHSVAAYIGGTAAQEAIKVITEQFVPVNNTYIYNAMKQSSTTIQL